MKRVAAIAALLVALAQGLIAGTPAVQPAQVASAKTDGRKSVTLELRNPGEAVGEFALSAGTIFQATSGARAVALRSARTELPPGAAAEMTVPVAELSFAPAPVGEESTKIAPGAEPKLSTLLSYLEKHADVPRGTSQCVVFALLEDITFAQWQHWIGAAVAVPFAGQPAAAAPPNGLVEALDAITILREIASGQAFRLQSDDELKLRALRQPGLRGKAWQIFGAALPGDAPPSAAGPPSVGQLLHTKPGDYCPICRMRAQMQRAASDL